MGNKFATGRPRINQEDKKTKLLHLILTAEEHAICCLVAKSLGLSATGFYRSAIHQLIQHKTYTIEELPQNLWPGVGDKTSMNFSLTFSEVERRVLDQNTVDDTIGGRYSGAIRKAALVMAMNAPNRTPEFEQALKRLVLAKVAAKVDYQNTLDKTEKRISLELAKKSEKDVKEKLLREQEQLKQFKRTDAVKDATQAIKKKSLAKLKESIRAGTQAIKKAKNLEIQNVPNDDNLESRIKAIVESELIEIAKLVEEKKIAHAAEYKKEKEMTIRVLFEKYKKNP